MSIVGQVFSEWKVVQELPASNFVCKCTKCGRNYRKINKYLLVNGDFPHCECITGKAVKGTEYLGKVYGTFKIISCSGRDNFIAQCIECGYLIAISKKDMELGSIPECRNHTNMPVKIELDTLYGDWYVIGKNSGKYICKCRLCSNTKEIAGWTILNNPPKCDCKKVNMEDEVGKVYGTWKLNKYLGNNKYTCSCVLCNKEKEIDIYYLRRDAAPYCKCRKNEKNAGNRQPLDNLIGSVFDTWKVESYADKSYYNCRCIECGEVAKLHAYKLKTGDYKSCQCTGRASLRGLSVEKQKEILRIRGANKIKPSQDLTGKTFGLWEVLEFAGADLWECKCTGSCGGTHRLNHTYDLTHGKTTSCGCGRVDKIRETTLEKFGVENYSMLNSKITDEQREIFQSPEKFSAYIKSFGTKPTIERISKSLGVNSGTVYVYIHKHNLTDLITVDKNSSQFEEDLQRIFGGVRNDKKALDGKEIDLFFKDKNFGIEFNGNYWNSELFKETKYHQNKSLLALSKGINIIHIFEYEWDDESQQKKIIDIVNMRLHPENNRVIHARECDIKIVDNTTSTEFQNKWHLMGSSPAQVHLGIFYNNELVGVMTFGKSRFNRTVDWELIRLAWKAPVAVVGGAEKLFKYFLKQYNPDSIVTYADITKFTGRVYKKLGFKLDGITDPEYIWYSPSTKDKETRYATRKNRLVSLGLGSEDESESTIMHNLGYIRIYDCGNLRFIWRKGKQQCQLKKTW